MKAQKAKLIGVTCGILCAVCVALYVASVRGEAEQLRAEALARYGGEQVEVCVATRDIAPGETIVVSAVEMRTWLAELLPDDAVTSIEDVVGLQAASSILEGEVISMRRFGNNSALIDVPTGYTALSVPTKEVQAVGGAISPGSLVDIYATGNSSTELIGKRVLVLATSLTSGSVTSGTTAWITLAVQPEAVEELVVAANTIDLYFTLPGQSSTASDNEGDD